MASVEPWWPLSLGVSIHAALYASSFSAVEPESLRDMLLEQVFLPILQVRKARHKAMSFTTRRSFCNVQECYHAIYLHSIQPKRIMSRKALILVYLPSPIVYAEVQRRRSLNHKPLTVVAIQNVRHDRRSFSFQVDCCRLTACSKHGYCMSA